ncbi:MAG: glycosyltransferase family 4 protein [Candidatus Aminicenantaceae bacterium]
MKRGKRIGVVTSDVPFAEGGHLIIARSIIQALNEYGHEAALILTPQNRFGKQYQAYLATRLIDVEENGLGQRINQIISLRYPSYAVKHPWHVCWLNHRMREYYDLWDLLNSSLKLKSKIKQNINRKIFHFIDAYLLKHNVTKLYAQSRTIQSRLIKWGNITSTVLYPPPPPRNYRTDSYQNFIFSVSRLHELKRLDLLIDAFAYLKNKELKAFIIGVGPDKERLENKIKENHLENKVIMLGPADEQTVLDHYARCLAVFFAPLREDYGFVTGEAFSCKKAVITTSDSGGPSELVKNNQTGFIADPDPKKIAEKIDRLAEEKNLAEQMGQNAFEFISQLTWEKTIKTLIL